NRRTDVAAHRPRQTQQVGRRAVLEPLATQLGAAAVLVVEVGARQQLGQLAIAGAVAADQQHPVRLVALGLVLDPDIDADDGLDALAARALVELDHAEQVGEVGDAKRRHAVVGRGDDRLVELDDAVGDRVFGVEAKVNEARSAGETWGGSHERILPDMARLGPAGGLQTVRYRRGKPWGPDALARCACVVDNQIVDLHIINIYKQGSAQLRKFAMPTFVLLNKLTPAGFEKIHQDPDRLDAVSTEI